MPPMRHVALTLAIDADEQITDAEVRAGIVEELPGLTLIARGSSNIQGKRRVSAVIDSVEVAA